MSKTLLRGRRAFIESLDEFTNKQEPSTIKNMFAGFLWVEIIVKHFPFLEWVDAKFIQELKKLPWKYLSALGRKVLATNTTALVSTGDHDCLTIKRKRRFSVEQDFLLARTEFLFHAANSIVVWSQLRTVVNSASCYRRSVEPGGPTPRTKVCLAGLVQLTRLRRPWPPSRPSRFCALE